MANIIAVVWDFDKTLVDGYMQEPIFEEYGVDPQQFWAEVDALPRRYLEEQGVLVNPDTVYLNHFIRYAREGRFPGLNNARLREFGGRLRFYPGVPEIFDVTRAVVDRPEYQEYDIKVEHYVVSTGLLKVIQGSIVAPHMEHVWGCELIDGAAPDGSGSVISEIGYTIDNTSKTRALFEINKGVNSEGRAGIDVNTSIPEEHRRVRFENIIYVADGPSDVPSFSLTNHKGGSTFAVYPKGDSAAMHQVERLREEGRIHMYAEADYSEDTTARLWLCNKVRERAEAIREQERSVVMASASPSPRHLS